MTKWQSDGRDGWKDVGTEVSEQLEYAWMKGFPKVGVWDNGLFREFDLKTMKETPGIMALRRIRKPKPPAPEQSDAPALDSRPGSRASL